MSNRAFSVALVDGTTLLTGNPATNTINGGVIDLVGATNSTQNGDIAPYCEFRPFTDISRQAAGRRINFADYNENNKDFERIDYREAASAASAPRCGNDGAWGEDIFPIYRIPSGGKLAFSKTSGFYDNPFNLELSTGIRDGIIRYTTDESEPTKNSKEYTAPIDIANRSNILDFNAKAEAFDIKINVKGTADEDTVVELRESGGGNKLHESNKTDENGIFELETVISSHNIATIAGDLRIMTEQADSDDDVTVTFKGTGTNGTVVTLLESDGANNFFGQATITDGIFEVGYTFTPDEINELSYGNEDHGGVTIITDNLDDITFTDITVVRGETIVFDMQADAKLNDLTTAWTHTDFLVHASQPSATITPVTGRSVATVSGAAGAKTVKISNRGVEYASLRVLTKELVPLVPDTVPKTVITVKGTATPGAVIELRETQADPWPLHGIATADINGDYELTAALTKSQIENIVHDGVSPCGTLAIQTEYGAPVNSDYTISELKITRSDDKSLIYDMQDSNLPALSTPFAPVAPGYIQYASGAEMSDISVTGAAGSRIISITNRTDNWPGINILQTALLASAPEPVPVITSQPDYTITDITITDVDKAAVLYNMQDDTALSTSALTSAHSLLRRSGGTAAVIDVPPVSIEVTDRMNVADGISILKTGLSGYIPTGGSKMQGCTINIKGTGTPGTSIIVEQDEGWMHGDTPELASTTTHWSEGTFEITLPLTATQVRNNYGNIKICPPFGSTKVFGITDIIITADDGTVVYDMQEDEDIDSLKISFATTKHLKNGGLTLNISDDEGSKALNITDREGDSPTELWGGIQIIKGTLMTALLHRDFLDGSAERAPDAPWEKSLSKGNVIRARVFDEKGNPLTDRIYTQSYFVGLGGKYTGYPVISLSTDNDNLFAPDLGVYANPYSRSNDWERPVHFEIIEPDGSTHSQDMGIRMHGGASRGDSQKSFRLYARGSYDSDNPTLNYDVFDGAAFDVNGKPITEFQRILLRSTGNTKVAEMMRDPLLQARTQNMTNMLHQAYRPSVVFINGEFWGYYNIRERIDDYFIRDNAKVDNRNNIIFVNPDEYHGGWDGEPGIYLPEHETYEEMYDWFEGLDEYDWAAKDGHKMTTDEYKKAQTFLDVDNFIDYWATEMIISNYDWPGNNIKMWRYDTDFPEEYDSKVFMQDGRWRYIVCDLDFGYLLYEGDVYVKHFNNIFKFLLEDSAVSSDWPNYAWSTTMFRRLMSNDEFRGRFLVRCIDILNTALNEKELQADIDALKTKMSPVMTEHHNRWSCNSLTKWSTEVTRFRSEVEGRLTNFANQIKTYFDDDDIGSLVELSVKLTTGLGALAENNDLGYVKVNGTDILDTTVGVTSGVSWKGSYQVGTEQIITAIPQGYGIFDKFIINGDEVFDNPLKFKLEEATDVQAYFVFSQDSKDIDDARIAVEECGFADVSVGNVGSEEAAKAHIKAIVDSIVEKFGVTAKIVDRDYRELTDDVNGRYRFYVELSKGKGTSLTTSSLSLRILPNCTGDPDTCKVPGCTICKIDETTTVTETTTTTDTGTGTETTTTTGTGTGTETTVSAGTGTNTATADNGTGTAVTTATTADGTGTAVTTATTADGTGTVVTTATTADGTGTAVTAATTADGTGTVVTTATTADGTGTVVTTATTADDTGTDTATTVSGTGTDTATTADDTGTDTATTASGTGTVVTTATTADGTGTDTATTAGGTGTVAVTTSPEATTPNVTTEPEYKYGVISNEGDEEGAPTIFCFIEILLYLVKMPSNAADNPAAILSPEGEAAGEPTDITLPVQLMAMDRTFFPRRSETLHISGNGTYTAVLETPGLNPLEDILHLAVCAEGARFDGEFVGDPAYFGTSVEAPARYKNAYIKLNSILINDYVEVGNTYSAEGFIDWSFLGENRAGASFWNGWYYGQQGLTGVNTVPVTDTKDEAVAFNVGEPIYKMLLTFTISELSFDKACGFNCEGCGICSLVVPKEFLTLDVAKEVNTTEVNVTGLAAYEGTDSIVKIYCDGEPAGEFTPNKIDRYRGSVTIPDIEGKYVITAELEGLDGEGLTVEEVIIYDRSAVAVSTVTMHYYGQSIIYNILKPPAVPPSYIYRIPSVYGEKAKQFTFVVEFDDPEIDVSDVVVVIEGMGGAIHRVPAEYDENKKVWIAYDIIQDVFNAPAFIDVEFYKTTIFEPIEFDTAVIDDFLEEYEDILAELEAESNYKPIDKLPEDHYSVILLKELDIFANILDDSEKLNSLTGEEFEKLYDDFFEKFDEYQVEFDKDQDELDKSQDELDEFVNGVPDIADLIDIDEMFDTTVTIDDSSGYIESEMLENGFTAIPKTDGGFIYQKDTETQIITVDFELNFSHVIDISEILNKLSEAKEFFSEYETVFRNPTNVSAFSDEFIQELRSKADELMSTFFDVLGLVQGIMEELEKIEKKIYEEETKDITKNLDNAKAALNKNQIEIANSKAKIDRLLDSYENTLLKEDKFVGDGYLRKKTQLEYRLNAEYDNLQKLEKQPPKLKSNVDNLSDKLKKFKIPRAMSGGFKALGIVGTITSAIDNINTVSEVIFIYLSVGDCLTENCQNCQCKGLRDELRNDIGACGLKILASIILVEIATKVICTQIAGFLSAFSAPPASVLIWITVVGTATLVFLERNNALSGYKQEFPGFRTRSTEVFYVCLDKCKPEICELCGGKLPKHIGQCPPKPPTPTPSKVDPAGYVYEAVPSNRMSGAEAICYYAGDNYPFKGAPPVQNADELGIQPWNAEDHDQQNPIITDREGAYAWDVPRGWWQVKIVKDGYEDMFSNWMPVPPVQMNVNIGMICKDSPSVQSVNAYPTGVEIIFDKYMDTATLRDNSIQVLRNGIPVTGHITFTDSENSIDPMTEYADYINGDFASKIKFIPSFDLLIGDITVNINQEAKSYAGVSISENFFQTSAVKIEPDSLEVDNVRLDYDETGNIVVSVLPMGAAVGKKITAVSDSPFIASVEGEAIVDEDGKAVIEVVGELPGTVNVTVSLDGTALQKNVSVSVGMLGHHTCRCRQCGCEECFPPYGFCGKCEQCIQSPSNVIYDMQKDPDLKKLEGTGGSYEETEGRNVLRRAGNPETSVTVNMGAMRTITVTKRGGTSQGTHIRLNELNAKPDHSYKFEVSGRLINPSAEVQARLRFEGESRILERETPAENGAFSLTHIATYKQIMGDIESREKVNEDAFYSIGCTSSDGTFPDMVITSIRITEIFGQSFETTPATTTDNPPESTTSPAITTTTAVTTTTTAVTTTEPVTTTATTETAVSTSYESTASSANTTESATTATTSPATTATQSATTESGTGTVAVTTSPEATTPNVTTEPEYKYGVISNEGDEEGAPTIFCFIEILLYLVKMPSNAADNPAAILSPEGEAAGEPTIFCAIEILLYIVGLPTYKTLG
ncbi:MAG: CotH kinase family protein [Oscillospiraceae bacterium]|nr:CotH kinase family protein [Oscillospiraceae bacterium]